MIMRQRKIVIIILLFFGKFFIFYIIKSKWDQYKNKTILPIYDNNGFSHKIITNEYIRNLLNESPIKLDSSIQIRKTQVNVFQIKLTLDDRKILSEMLASIGYTLTQNKVTYFLTGNTLLNSYRFHDMAIWDFTIELMIHINYRDKIQNILSKSILKFKIEPILFRDKIIKLNNENNSWPFIILNYYSTKDDGNLMDLTKKVIFSRNDIFPLHLRPMLMYMLPAPKDTFKYLVNYYHYGSGCFDYDLTEFLKDKIQLIERNCADFINVLPFVEHFQDINGVREILQLKNVILSDLIISEPSYAVGDKVRLRLKDGYEANYCHLVDNCNQ